MRRRSKEEAFFTFWGWVCVVVGVLNAVVAAFRADWWSVWWALVMYGVGSLCFRLALDARDGAR